MKKGWTTTKLIAIGSLGVLNVVLALFGAGIAAVTAIPLAGATNAFVAPASLVFCCLVIDQFGAATLLRFIFSILALPLPLTGTVGFLPKIPISVVGGLITDGLYFLLKQNKRIASLVIGGAFEVYLIPAVVMIGRMFNMPGIEKTAGLLFSPFVFTSAIVAGAIGGYLGFMIYNKIKNTSVVKRIQG